MIRPPDRRPEATEYAPYAARYIELVPTGDILDTLDRQGTDTRRFFAGIPEERGQHRYAPGKWSIREVLGHVVDAERIFAYRVLRIARGDQTPLAGFDQEAYVRAAGFERRRLGDLAEEWDLTRRASLALLRRLEDGAWERRGTANGVEATVRALVWIMAGHELHHRQIVATKYLG